MKKSKLIKLLRSISGDPQVVVVTPNGDYVNPKRGFVATHEVATPGLGLVHSLESERTAKALERRGYRIRKLRKNETRYVLKE